MPIVNPTTLPQGIADTRAYDTTRAIVDPITQALLMALANGRFGQVPTSPTSQQPGTFNFPPGSQSPLEAAQIRQMGGVPTNAGVLARSTTIPRPGGVEYQPPTRLGLLPNLQRQSTQADIDLKRAQADQAKTFAQYYATPPTTPSGRTPKPPTTPSTPFPEQVTSPLLRAVATKAAAGDARAADAIRGLALEKNDPEAIAILQLWGEI